MSIMNNLDLKKVIEILGDSKKWNICYAAILTF
jgi:hypothetical protein